MFRLGLAIVFAIVARIQGKKAQQSVSQSFADLKRHRSFPLLVALLVFLALLIVAGFILSAVADVWEHANRLGGNWFALAVLFGIVCLSASVYVVARRFSRPTRRRLAQNEDTLFVTENLATPLPPPGDADLRFKRIRNDLRKATEDPRAGFLRDADIAFLKTDSKHRELIEDELKKHIRNFIDTASTESDAAGEAANRLAGKLIQLNPGHADWCKAELSTLKKSAG